MQSTTKNQLYILHKYGGEPYEYSVDIEGYSTLNKLKEVEIADHIHDLEDIMEDISMTDLTKICLLHVLRKKITGKSYNVMSEKTFQQIVDIIVHYKNWDAFGYLEKLGKIDDE